MDQARQAVNLDENLLANRISMLKQDEERLQKKIMETQKRAGQIHAIKLENEQKYNEKLRNQLNRSLHIEETRKKNYELRNMSVQKKKEHERLILEEKRREYEATKQMMAIHE